jgi:hypothetical protein
MYENRHGRFTAVDPLLASGKSANPQSFNRYIYCLNNPLIFTDSRGLQAGFPGKWYKSTKGDSVPVYVLNSDTSPTDYAEITERNKRGQLVSAGAGEYEGWEIRFNESGPLPDALRDELTYMLLGDFDYKGYEKQRNDEFEEAYQRSGAIEDRSLEIFFALEGGGGLVQSGIRGVGKGALESQIGSGAIENGENILMRTMKIGEDGLPITGQSATTLGARVPKDIAPSQTGIVQPNTGGMSVTPEGGQLPSINGKNLETFCIKCRDLGPNLTYRPDPLRPLDHGFIEPNKTMTVEDYQDFLMGTRPFWQPYKPK